MGYKNYRLSELLEIIGGGTPKTNIEEYWNGNISWLSVKDFNGDSKKVYTTEKKITELGLNNSSTKLLKEGDLIISARGTVGEIAQLGKAMAFNQSCYGLRAKEHITSNDFMYYALKYILKDIKNMTHGSVFDTITRSTFDVLSYPLPEMKEQKSIANILSNLDDKIEVNNKINQKLEEMAQAIFKQWFIDFDFPNEEGKPYKSSGGEMVESELGMIPKGWEVKELGEICNIQKGLSYKGKYMSDVGTPMINLGNIYPGGGYRKEKIKFYNGDFKANHIVSSGDIIIANTDMTQDRVILGSPIIVPKFNEDKIIFTHHLFAFRDVQIDKLFLYFYLKTPSFRERAETYATGTTVLALPKEAVTSIPMVIPSKKLIDEYSMIASKNIYKINNGNLQIDNLEKLRDTLLPKLMSGEIRVPTSN